MKLIKEQLKYSLEQKEYDLKACENLVHKLGTKLEQAIIELSFALKQV